MIGKDFILFIATAFIFFYMATVNAENLGVYGQVYTIAEPDLLSFIHDRLLQFHQDGRLKKMKAKLIKKVKEHVVRPTPVPGISDATNVSKEKVFFVTRNFVLKSNIYDSSARLLFSAGTNINPLNTAEMYQIAPTAVIPQFNETLIFIDADSESQVALAKLRLKKIKGIFKIILIKGSLKTASDSLGRIYFDQDGVLCHLFKITRVPAIVTRSGMRLEIKELPV